MSFATLLAAAAVAIVTAPALLADEIRRESNMQARAAMLAPVSVPPPMRDQHKPLTRLYLVHMVFMVVAWIVIIPLGILIGRYGRTFFRWLPVHRGLQMFAILCIFIGFFVAIAAQVMKKAMHFRGPHGQIGLTLFLLTFVQGAIGIGAHHYRAKTGRRWVGYLHMPLGLGMFALSIYNVHLGLALWAWKPPKYASYIVYAWASLVALLYLGGLLLIPKQRRHDRELEGRRPSYDSQIEKLTARRNS